MAPGTGQWRPVRAILTLTAGLAIATLVSHGCTGGQGHDEQVLAGLRLGGQAKEAVESIEDIPAENLLKSQEFRGYLHSTEPPLTLGKFIHLGCTQIVKSDAQHLLYTDDPDCPSVVLSDAAGFDLVISYTDGYCPREPTLDVRWIDHQLHFTIDKYEDRGGVCEDIAVPHVKGVRFNRHLSGSS